MPSELEQRLIAQYRNGPGRWIVVLYVDERGTIGGYRAGMAIMDSPIAYYSADGTTIGVFHIFAPPGENEKYAAAIAELKQRFPIERPLE